MVGVDAIATSRLQAVAAENVDSTFRIESEDHETNLRLKNNRKVRRRKRVKMTVQL